MRNQQRPHITTTPSAAARRTLDGFLRAAAAASGLAIAELDDGVSLRVRTANTTYQIWVCDSWRRGVIILGGRFFPDATRAVLVGATFGGSLLKLGWVGLGMRMEIHGHGTTIVTSPVQDIVINTRACEMPPISTSPPIVH